MEYLNKIRKGAVVLKKLSLISTGFSLFAVLISAIAIVMCVTVGDYEELIDTVRESTLNPNDPTDLKGIIAYWLQHFAVMFGNFLLTLLSYNYFKHVDETGTPFTYEGAVKLKRLGVITVLYGFVPTIVTFGIIFFLANGESVFTSSMNAFSLSSGILGIVLILVSYAFGHGAWLIEPETESEDKTETTE